MAVNKKSEKKWHIGLDGLPRICRATKRKCPRGGVITAHYTSLQEATSVADAVNKRIVEGGDFDREVLIANTGKGKGYVYGKSEKLLNSRRTLNMAIVQLSNVRDEARRQVLEQWEQSVGKEKGKMSTDKVDVYYNPEKHDVKTADYDKIKRDNINLLYSKDSTVRDYLITEGEDNAVVASDAYKEIMNTKFTVDAKVQISKDENGNIAISEDTKKTLNKLRELDDKIKQMEATKKNFDNELIHSMKRDGVDTIKMQTREMKLIPEHTERILDRKAMKDAGIYDEYVTPTGYRAAHLRFRKVA